MAYKYPYISDKKMYAAVMGACSYIRDKGYFNKAVSYYANKYGVDPDELAEEIRKRQGAGQKGKTRKYKYYLVEGWTDEWYNMYDYDVLFSQYEPQKWENERKRMARIIKATNRQNAEAQIPKGRLDRDFRMRGFCLTDYMIQEYETLKEAEDALGERAKMLLNVTY